MAKKSLVSLGCRLNHKLFFRPSCIKFIYIHLRYSLGRLITKRMFGEINQIENRRKKE